MLIYLLIFSYLIAPKAPGMGDIVHLWLEKIAWAESRNKNYAISVKGAIGKYQVMPITLKMFNKIFKAEYTLKDLHNKYKCYLVAKWLFLEDSKHFYKDKPVALLVKTINSYNLGAGKTDKGIYYHWYLNQICPGYFESFLADKKILWQGKRFLRIEI